MAMATTATIRTGLLLTASHLRAMLRAMLHRRSTIPEVLLRTTVRPTTTTTMRIGVSLLRALAATSSPVPEAINSRAPAERIRTRHTTIITGSMALTLPRPTAAAGMAAAVMHRPKAEATRLQVLAATLLQARDISPQVPVTRHQPVIIMPVMGSTKDIHHKVAIRNRQHSRPPPTIHPLRITAIILLLRMARRHLHTGPLRQLMGERHPDTAPPRQHMGHRCPATRHIQAMRHQRLATAHPQPLTSRHQAHHLELAEGGIHRGGTGRRVREGEAKSAARLAKQGTPRAGFSNGCTCTMIGSLCGLKVSIRRAAWPAPPT